MTDDQKKMKLLLREKGKLVARKLELEIEERIIERKTSMIGTKINALIDSMTEEKPFVNDEELRLATTNRYNAVRMFRERYPNITTEEARFMIDRALGTIKPVEQ